MNTLEEYASFIKEQEQIETSAIFETGRALLEAKIKFFDTQEGTAGAKSRRFNKWVKNDLDIAKSTANKRMQIYDRFGASGSALSHLGITKLEILASFPLIMTTEEIILGKNGDGIDNMTTTEIKKWKKELVPQKEKPSQAEELEKAQVKLEKVLNKIPDGSLSPEGYLKVGEQLTETIKKGTKELAEDQARVEGVQLDIPRKNEIEEEIIAKQEPLMISAPKEKIAEQIKEQLSIFSLEEINIIAKEAKQRKHCIVIGGEIKSIPFYFFCDSDRKTKEEFETEDDLKKHYRYWTKLLHPDKNNGDDFHFKRLDTEYRAIIGSNDDKRKYMKEYPRSEEW